MWRLDTYWFDVAVLATLLAVGSTLLGRFSEYQPRGRRLLEILGGIASFTAVAATAGRPWTYALLALVLLAVVAVHGWWLPRHGVNGWTAEPRARYYELLGLGPDGRRPLPSPRASGRRDPR